jgi:cytochrome c biogenesis protein CcmG/thiol:disulfide interchange protein DsbE
MNRKVLLVGLVFLVPLVAVLYLNLGHDPTAIETPMVGRQAPPFQLRPAGGGNPVALADFAGTPVVLNFWASWCLPCAQEHPFLVSAARSWQGKVQFLGVVYEDEEGSAQQYLRSRGGAPYPSLMDPNDTTAIAYGIYGVPETFFIDASGKIIDKYVGPLNRVEIDKRLAAMTSAEGTG